MRSLQRQRQKELSKRSDGHVRLGTANKAKALAVDDCGVEHAAIRDVGQDASAIAGGRTGLSSRRSVPDISLVDLVAVHVISAWRIGITSDVAVDDRRSAAISGVIDLPIGREIPTAIAHAPTLEWPFAIKRQSSNLARRRSDGPVSARAGCARTAAASADISFAHVQRWTVSGIILASTHRAFVNIKSDIERLAHRRQRTRPKVDAILYEVYARTLSR